MTDIELTNFQKHAHFKAQFSNRVNVLYGQSDAGKSCIIRAIRWVMFNEPKGDVVRKEDTDRTSVTLGLDSGARITKIKSNTENAYVLLLDGKEKRFDSIGKTIPDEIVKAFGVFPMPVDDESLILNVAPQLALPFLISESATFRMRVFNKLSGNDMFDKVSQSLNKDILGWRRSIKDKEEDHKTKSADLGLKQKQLAEAETKLAQARDIAKSLETKHKQFDTLKTLCETLSKFCDQLLGVQYRLKQIVIPPDVSGFKIRAKTFDRLRTLASDKRSRENEREMLTLKLSKMRVPESLHWAWGRAKQGAKIKSLLDDLKTKQTTRKCLYESADKMNANLARIEKINLSKDRAVAVGKLRQALEDLNTKKSSFDGTRNQFIITQNGLDTLRHQYADLLQKAGNCPLCTQQMSSQLIDKLSKGKA